MKTSFSAEPISVIIQTISTILSPSSWLYLIGGTFCVIQLCKVYAANAKATPTVAKSVLTCAKCAISIHLLSFIQFALIGLIVHHHLDLPKRTVDNSAQNLEIEKISWNFVYIQAIQCRTPFILTKFFKENSKFQFYYYGTKTTSSGNFRYYLK